MCKPKARTLIDYRISPAILAEGFARFVAGFFIRGGDMALTAKQEAFCLAYMETGNASEAYRNAYNAEKMKPETVNRTAKELLDHPKITARLDELRKEVVERNKITVDSLLIELEEARKIALAAPTPQSSAAVAATLGKAKLLGFGAHKVELTGKNGGPIQCERSPADLTDEELAAELAKYGIEP